MTVREHVSFSEIKNWKECPYRHKLMYIDGIQTYENNPYAEFGTVVHDSIENYLKTKKMDTATAQINLRAAWDKFGFDSEDFVQKMIESRAQHGMSYKHESFENWAASLETILGVVPSFLDEEFPGWELVAAEDQIYEVVHSLDVNFKGYIDAIISVENKGKKIYWVIDWKTSGARGWAKQKRMDFMTQAQVGFYKKFWSDREGIDLKNVRCAYVLLKRNTKPEKCINMIPVSVGPKFVERTDKLLRSMVTAVNRGLKLKNRNSCRFCAFYQTEHCT